MADVHHVDAKSDTSSEQVTIKKIDKINKIDQSTDHFISILFSGRRRLQPNGSGPEDSASCDEGQGEGTQEHPAGHDQGNLLNLLWCWRDLTDAHEQLVYNSFALLYCFHPFQAEADYYREVHLLDLKFQSKYDEINKKRDQVISGAYEPSGAEVEYPSDEEDEEEDGEVG